MDFEEIDRETTPLGILTLHRYESEGERGYEVRLDDAFLMATHGALGEEAMVTLARRRAAVADRVLIGGLGAGHTLRAALDALPEAIVEVVEIGAKVVTWNREYFDPSLGAAVDDPRVTIHIADLADQLRRARPPAERYDLVLLDVDNGPGWLASAANAWLYTTEGLRATREALAHGGVLAIWSPDPNPRLAAALDVIFGAHEAIATRQLEGFEAAAGEASPTDVVYLARR